MGALPPPRRPAAGSPPPRSSTLQDEPVRGQTARTPLPIPKPKPRPEVRRDSTDRLPPPPDRVAPTAPPTRQPSGPRPFRWSGLPQVSRSEAKLLTAVQWAFPAEPGKAVGILTRRFKELFELEAQVVLHHVYLATPAQLADQIPQPACMQQLALAPHLPRGLVEVELALAHAAIDQLLGGAAGESVILRPLTDIEEGVLGYVMLEGLRALSSALDPDRPRIRLEGAVASREEAQTLVSLETTLVVLQFTLALGDVASGYFRLFLPATALRGLEPTPGSESALRRRAAWFESNGSRLANVESLAWVEIAHCDLTTGELAGLASGDVVLVEDVTARPDRSEGGTGLLKVGIGQHGAWGVTLAYDAEHGLHATLDALHVGAPRLSPRGREAESTGPAEGSAVDTSESELPSGNDEDLPDERAPELTEPPDRANPWDEPEHTNVTSSAKDADLAAPELLNDIPLHVSIELGRIPMSAEHVVALRSGQVLNLGKGPGDGVDLSVNGRIVAHGELVEIEGQLGVRVTALV